MIGKFERELRREFDALGLRAEISRSRKHPRVEWFDSHGKRHRLTFSGSPSDLRALLNAKADLRRKIREST